MSKLDRLWDWLLPGLISLSPMGAIAYHTAAAESETLRYTPTRVGRRAPIAGGRMGAAVTPLGRP
jgi:hypothetical protein